MRFLVACNAPNTCGGFLRFERVGRVLRARGHELAFTALATEGSWSAAPTLLQSPVLTLAEASQQCWDVVMVPGAGFPDYIVEQFKIFTDARYGIRVQHILNDRTKLNQFKNVNDIFKPHIVVFNNLDWSEENRHGLNGIQFHTILGAVNFETFYPLMYRTHPLCEDKWTIGGQARKNPVPLYHAATLLPKNTRLKLIGKNALEENAHSRMLAAQNRLQFTGVLEDEKSLRDYYASVDCLVMTETFAGWANIVAEAMACGVPVICTRHGTEAIAFDNETALVLQEPIPDAIAAAVTKLLTQPDLCHRLTENARACISSFSWEKYTNDLLAILAETQSLRD